MAVEQSLLLFFAVIQQGVSKHTAFVSPTPHAIKLRRGAGGGGEAGLRPVCTLQRTWGTAFFINLEESDVRKREMVRALNKIDGLPYQRWNASKPSFEQAVEVAGKSDFDDDETIGMVGCLLSHVSVFQHISEYGNDDELYMVLEDDWAPHPEFTRYWQDVRRNTSLPCDTDLIRLDVWGECKTKQVTTEPCECGGTHAMLVTRAGAAKLANFYLKLPNVQNIDCALASAPDVGIKIAVVNYGLGSWHYHSKRRSTIDGHFIEEIPNQILSN